MRLPRSTRNDRKVRLPCFVRNDKDMRLPRFVRNDKDMRLPHSFHSLAVTSITSLWNKAKNSEIKLKFLKRLVYSNKTSVMEKSIFKGGKS
jgi:hypothetical protein